MKPTTVCLSSFYLASPNSPFLNNVGAASRTDKINKNDSSSSKPRTERNFGYNYLMSLSENRGK